MKKSDDHFKERHRGGQRGNEQADVEDCGEDAPARNVREDHRERNEDESRARIRRDAEREYGGHHHEAGEKRGLNREKRNPERSRRNVGALRKIGAVRDENAGAEGERKEGVSHCAQDRPGRQVFRSEAQKILHAFHGAIERESADDDGEHHHEEHRHQQFGNALDSLLNAAAHGECREGEKGKKPGNVDPAGGDDFPEVVPQGLRIFRNDAHRQGLGQVGDAPAADDAVVGKNQKRGEDCEGAQERKGSSPDAAHGADGRASAAPADRNLCHEEHEARRERKDDVGKNEGSSAVDAGPEREFPDGAEADRRAGRGENEAEARAPLHGSRSVRSGHE